MGPPALSADGAGEVVDRHGRAGGAVEERGEGGGAADGAGQAAEERGGAGGAAELRGGAADGGAQGAAEAAEGHRGKPTKQARSGKKMCCAGKTRCEDIDELYCAGLEIAGDNCDVSASDLRAGLCKRDLHTTNDQIYQVAKRLHRNLSTPDDDTRRRAHREKPAACSPRHAHREKSVDAYDDADEQAVAQLLADERTAAARIAAEAAAASHVRTWLGEFLSPRGCRSRGKAAVPAMRACAARRCVGEMARAPLTHCLADVQGHHLRSGGRRA